MSLPEFSEPSNPRRRRFTSDPSGTERRARFYADRLDKLRYASLITRCQLAKADDEDRRALLGFRLEVVDARAADIHARLISARTAA